MATSSAQHVHEQAQADMDLCSGIAALPYDLLPLLLPGTSIQDKKALRQTCKFLRNELDDKLVCTKLTLHTLTPLATLQRFLKRLHHVDVVKEITFNLENIGRRFTQLFKHLPHQITRLVIHTSGSYNNLKELGRLPCLTTLVICGGTRVCKGLEHISGLTRLECYRPKGSLEHLAPALKYLSIVHYTLLQSMQHLTNLEVLGLRPDAAEDFFRYHGQVPVKHIILNQPCCSSWFTTVPRLESAPRTLTRLTFNHTFGYALPETITHLQLLNVHGDYDFTRNGQSLCAAYFEHAANRLSGLFSLDVHAKSLRGWQEIKSNFDAFSYLGSFTNLQNLRICLNVNSLPCSLEEILTELPAVATAVESGVRLTVVVDPTEFWGAVQYPQACGPVWDMPS